MGNLVFTCPGNSRTEPTGYVCALTPGGVCTIVADELYFPNGLAFAPDGDLVLAETRRQRLWRGGWDPATRRWLEPKPFCQTMGAPIGPDGLAIDSEGQIFAPDGTRRGLLATLGANTSNCAFDPGGALGLVVTETERGQILGFDLAARGARLFAGGPPIHSSGKTAHVR